MELEGTGRRDAEMLDQSKYPLLNINGAIIIRKNQVSILIIVEGGSRGAAAPSVGKKSVTSRIFS